jgi:hypothetical protein
MQKFDGMEHRLTTRSDVDIAAEVELNGGRPITGIIRNVSLTGVFVELSGVELSARDAGAGHGMIRLTFPLSGRQVDDGADAVAQWQGFIVRRDERGVGAVFDSDLEEYWDGLAGLLGFGSPSRSRDREFLGRCFQHLTD